MIGPDINPENARDHMHIKRMGMDHLIHPFPDRHTGPQPENHHRHKERPEIGFLAIAKRVFFIRLLGRQLQPQKQKPLIAGIDQ